MDDDRTPTTPITPETRAFIQQRFHSVAEIEVFLHLVRNGGAWSARTLGSATGLGESHALVTLQSLQRAGLVVGDDGLYEAGATSDEAGATSDEAGELDAAYRRYRRRVIEIVASADVTDDVTEP